MARLAFYDYHNMIAILEKYMHNVEFCQIVDFVEASHIRIETTDEGTKILATVDDFFFSKGSVFPLVEVSNPYRYAMLKSKKYRVNEFSSNIATAVGEGSGTPTEPHHAPSPEAQQSSPTAPSSLPLLPATTETIPTGIPTDIPTLRQYSSRARIAQSSALPTTVDEPASPLGDDSQGEAFFIVFGLEAEQDRENIIKTSALPHDSPPRARIKLLADKDGGGAEPSGEDATIKGRSLETGEETCVEKSTERGNNDTKELVNVLTSLDAASILTSGFQVVSVPPAAEVATVSIPTGSGLVPTASLIFTTASVVTPYSRRKGKEKMVESDIPKKKKLQEQINEYEQFVVDLSIREKIDMINELVKYQDHYAKVLKYQAQQSKPLSKKQQREFYMSVLTRERFKRKGLRLEQDSTKKMKTAEDVSEEDLKAMIEDLTQLWTLVRETLRIRQATSDKEKELWVELKRLYEPDVEDQLWTHT
nr:hypothetical protein [Tanacetum cinerariifolium]